MKFLTAAVVFALASLAVAEVDLERMCMEKTGASAEEIMEARDQGTFNVSPVGKCLMACVVEAMGMMRDDKIDQAAWDLYMKDVSGVTDPEFLREVDKYSKCVAPATGLDRCDAAYTFFTCSLGHTQVRFNPSVRQAIIQKLSSKKNM